MSTNPTNPTTAGAVEAPAKTTVPLGPGKPKRADALRNYEKLVRAGRAAFTEDGSSASLEDIARRAEVGIGTLYRHFPSRQHLLEAVYIEELEAMAASAEDLDDLPPWDALSAWLHRFVGYATTKRAVAEELLAYMATDHEFFARSRGIITEVGDRLIGRAQQAGVVRPDVTFLEVGRMVSGIAAIRASNPDEIHRILDVALDGLRYRPAP